MNVNVRDVIDVLEALPDTVRAIRLQRRLSIRRAAEEIGIGHITLHYFETRERAATLTTALMILEWIEQNVARELEISRPQSRAS